MLKTIRFALVALFMLSGAAFAQVDVNKADQITLDGIKGIGPATSKRILEERKKGEFKNWADLESRVKGVGGKKAASLSNAGLTVNGQTRPDKPAGNAKTTKAGSGSGLKTADATQTGTAKK